MPSRHLHRCLSLPVTALLLASLSGCNHSPAPVAVLPVEAEPITPANIAKWCRSDLVLEAVDISDEINTTADKSKTSATLYKLAGEELPLLIIVIAPPNDLFNSYRFNLLLSQTLQAKREEPSWTDAILGQLTTPGVPLNNYGYPALYQALDDSGYQGGMTSRAMFMGLPCYLALGTSGQTGDEILVAVTGSITDQQTSLFTASPLAPYDLVENIFAHVAAQIAAEAALPPASPAGEQ